ncbi:MAG: beta-lactamase family protein [Clostridiales bacterium]|nr:beta-lactamase family protein [Clostridiales bacterium]
MNKERLSNNCNAFLDEVMNLNDLPGLAIGVSVGGADFIGVRGYRDYSERVPLQKDDVFHCASVSKLFTSSAIMKLAEAGALHLEDRLCELLPELHIADKRFEDIRLWNMLTHTSGLGDVSDYHWYDRETDADSLRRYVYESEEVLNQPMLWAPQESPAEENSRFRYSNIAYEILGQIVAECSGRMPDAKGSLSYENFVGRYLLMPAGMEDSTMKTFERNLNNVAQPYEKKPDRSIGPVEYYPYTRQHAPSSTLTSTAGDLLRWGRAHLTSARGDGPLLKPGTYQTIWCDYATVPNNGEKMGIGWFMREQEVAGKSYQLYGHEGTDDGFRASFWMCSALDMVTVVLSNLSGAPVKRINKKLFHVVAESE